MPTASPDTLELSLDRWIWARPRPQDKPHLSRLRKRSGRQAVRNQPGDRNLPVDQLSLVRYELE